MTVRAFTSGGSAAFAGWVNNWSSLGVNNMQYIQDIQTDSTRIVISGGNGGAASNVFRWALRSNPTSFTAPATPIADDCNAMCGMGDNDTYIVTFTGVPGCRVYRYRFSTGVYTDMAFPEVGTHDGCFAVAPDPTNTDIVYIGTAAAAAAGQASVWRLVISTSTWTELFAFATSNSNFIRNIFFSQGEMFVGTGNFVSAVSRVFRSTNAGYTAFTQIAGDSINGSWAAGTKRSASVEVNPYTGVMYAGLSGTTAGDAEVWRSNNRGQSWTQVGGDGLNSGWTGLTGSVRFAMLGDKMVCGIGGSAAGNAEVWQYNEPLGTWSQIGGDGIAGSWSTQLAAFQVFVDPQTNALFASGGNNTVNTSFLYTISASPFSGVGGTAFKVLNRKRFARLQGI